ncbi:MAG: type II toxin-antitoxin system VapC family toxin [Myxococcales bacterium]|nr:type II toxin-antitoxin system VapC family toxin [Myxococcales bacterium]
MKALLDTHLLLWAVEDDDRLPPAARAIVADPLNQLWFSAASILEVQIKTAIGRPDFRVDASQLRTRLLAAGAHELPISGGHAADLVHLPPLHKDPFDRMLVAQARGEGLTLVTHDEAVAAYGRGILGV